jgi:hypothetical protein
VADDWEDVKPSAGGGGAAVADADWEDVPGQKPAAKPGLLDSALAKGNEYAGKFLGAAGLPTSLSDVPHWTKGLFGQNEDSQPFWKPAQEAIQHPSQESIVGAVPIIGPGAVAASKDVRAGNYGGAAATLGGTIAGPLAAGEVRPGLNAAKSQVIAAKDTLSNVAKVAAPHSMTAGLVDALVPDATQPPKVHGAYSEFEGESGKPVPVSKSPVPRGYTGPAGVKAAQKAAQKAAAQSPIVTPTTPVPESEGRPATWKNTSVADLASTGNALTRPAAVQAQLRQLDVPNVGLIADPNATMTPSSGAARSVTHFDAQGNPLEPLGQGEPEIELMEPESVGPRINASGAPGGGGLEEQGRMTSENAQGVKYFRENPGGGRSPLVGLGRQDLKAGPGQKIIRVDANGTETVLDSQPLRQPSRGRQ